MNVDRRPPCGPGQGAQKDVLKTLDKTLTDVLNLPADRRESDRGGMTFGSTKTSCSRLALLGACSASTSLSSRRGGGSAETGFAAERRLSGLEKRLRKTTNQQFRVLVVRLREASLSADDHRPLRWALSKGGSIDLHHMRICRPKVGDAEHKPCCCFTGEERGGGGSLHA
jgi:hypothetical protein